MSGNISFLGNKIFEIPPFFQTRPGDLGKKVHACSLRFSALNRRVDVDDTRHSWGQRVSGALEERGELQVVQRQGTDAQDGTAWMKHRKGRGREWSEGLVAGGAFIPLPGRDVTQQQRFAQGRG